MKQIDLFGEQFSHNQKEQKYSTKIEAPIYEPKNKKPHIMELCDKHKTHRLMKDIENLSLDFEEKMFLMDAAREFAQLPITKIGEKNKEKNAT